MADQAGTLPLEQFDRLATALADAEPSLRRLAQRLCGGGADANDLVQDTFERAVRRGIPVGIRSPRAWLAAIMHHLFIDRCRAAARHSIATAPSDVRNDVLRLEPDVAEPAWMQITIDDVRDALEHIEPVYRDVYRMHTFEHLSHDEIAQQLSVGKLTVATRLFRARRKLREVLVQRFGLEDAP